jgi:hypothetical protein
MVSRGTSGIRMQKARGGKRKPGGRRRRQIAEGRRHLAHKGGIGFSKKNIGTNTFVQGACFESEVLHYV